LKSIIFLDKHASDWSTIEQRQSLLEYLEYTAQYIQYSLPRLSRTKDGFTTEWLTGNAVELAEGIRQYKKWILTPKIDTYEHLLQAIVSIFKHVLDDNWGELPQNKPEKIPFRPVKFAVNFLKNIILGISPLIFLAILIQIVPQIATNAEVVGAAFVAAFIWLVVSLANQFDTNLKDKIDIVTKVKGLITPNSK
jgi:hypothetical protein